MSLTARYSAVIIYGSSISTDRMQQGDVLTPTLYVVNKTTVYSQITHQRSELYFHWVCNLWILKIHGENNIKKTTVYVILKRNFKNIDSIDWLMDLLNVWLLRLFNDAANY
jgi:hypothetical protein